jgi:hypothetical protein
MEALLAGRSTTASSPNGSPLGASCPVIPDTNQILKLRVIRYRLIADMPESGVRVMGQWVIDVLSIRRRLAMVTSW